MQALLRQCKDGPDGVTEYTDTEVSGDSLTIGSAADCTVQLLGEAVAPEHAVIRGAAGRITLSCRAGQRVRLNGEPTGSATLNVGDLLEIGGHRLKLVDPPMGFELALEIWPDPNVSASSFERAFRTDLANTWLSRRRGAWTLLIVTLLGALLIPLASIHLHRAGRGTPPGVVDDTFWTAGPLSSAHELATGRRCDGCHESLFVHVRDSACRDCHKTVADHVLAARLKQTSLRQQRCAECHQEHNQSAASVVIRSNALCTDCHAHPERRFGALQRMAVTGFASKQHPPFTVDLLTPVYSTPGTVAVIQWQATREPISQAQEQSNLNFSHAKHLEASRVRKPGNNAPLGCSDCHTLGADGEHFIPVTMQRTCMSCHELTFDSSAPYRQLPHGRPRDAMLLIQDYYARQVVDPHPPVAPTDTSFQRRRLPGQADATLFEDTSEVCKAATFDCAMQRARAQIDNQFTKRGCVSCHVVVDTHASNVLERYQVTPIRLTYDYFPDAHFSHRSHAVQKGKTADEACLSCHSATTTDSSNVVMIPDLPKCLECHTQAATRDKVQLQCISCHTYHPKQIIASETGEARRE
jgi:predicted CXXCH cytochrome family protein